MADVFPRSPDTVRDYALMGVLRGDGAVGVAGEGEGEGLGEVQVAFTEIIERHQAFLLNFFVRRGVTYSDADDMAQDCFLRVYGARARYEPIRPFRSYLATIAFNVRTDFLRRAGRWQMTDIDEREEMQQSLFTRDVTGASDAASDVNVALGQLSEKLADAMRLSLFDGLNYGEIAAALDIPVGTVKSRMAAAMGQLRAFFNDTERS